MVKGAHERVVAKSSGALFEHEALCQTDDDSSKVSSRCSCVLFPQLCGMIQRSLHKSHNLLRCIIKEIDWDKESVGQVQSEKILHEGFLKGQQERETVIQA